MMIENWPREFPGVHWFDEEEERAVLQALREGAPFRYYGRGKPCFVDAFEAAAREFYASPYALALGSGTGGLITAMQALGIGPGCEVIVPAYMWVATISAVVQNNAIPVLCEVDDTLTMDVKDLERKITPRTRLIVPVHMSGGVCDMPAIMELAGRHGIPVLEDCAQANGGKVGGQPVGTFGALGMFSLQINKNITAGEGGLLVTRDPRLFTRAAAIHDLGVPWINGTPTEPEPWALAWGQGRRMSELCGAVASVQLRKLPQIVEHMRASHRRIQARLEGLPGLQKRRFHDDEGHTGSFVILILKTRRRAVDVAQSLRGSGLSPVCRLIDFGLHVYSNVRALVQKVPLSPAGNPWRLPENAESAYDYALGACPQSDDLFERSVLISVPSRLTREQEDAAAAAIRRAVEASGE